MKIKQEYKQPAIEVLSTEPLMENEPGMNFASGEIDGDEEGGVLSKEQHDFFDVDSVLNKYVPNVFSDVYSEEEE